MRPIIGVNGDCLWLCGDVCHCPLSLSAPRSHGKLRRRLTGTGVGSNFRFVSDLELKPARGRSRGISPLQGNDKESGFTKSVNMSARSAVVAAS